MLWTTDARSNLQDLIAVFLLHWALLPDLPLQLRAQKPSLVASPPEASPRFLERLYRELLHVTNKETLDQLRSVTSRPVGSTGESSIPQIAALQSAERSEGKAEEKGELLDFGDGRLFHFLARKFLSADADGDMTSAPSEEAARFVVPGDVGQRVRWLWAVVSARALKPGAGEKALAFPLQLGEEEPVGSTSPAVEPGEEPRGQDADQSSSVGTGATGNGERCLEVCNCAAEARANEVRCLLMMQRGDFQGSDR